MELDHFKTDGAVTYAGDHILSDFWGVDPAKCMDVELIERACIEACELAGATVLHSHFHSFGDGCGVTGVVALAESHCSVHTWNEAGLMTFDMFTCGAADPKKGMRHLRAVFQPKRVKNRNQKRGIVGG